MRILFMGTPDFAVPSLRALYDEFGITAVVTQPDKPKGRGYTLTPPPVKVFAAEHGIPCYQPETFKNNAFIDTLKEIDPDMIVVVAFGKILPAYILDYPKYGCINVHGSLLPEYRGAAPMQRAIIDGKKQTGITTMYMAAGLDTGDMLEKKAVEIEENDNFENVHDKLSEAGAGLIVSTVKKLIANSIVPAKQDETLATYAAKIEKSDCLVDFKNSSSDVHNLIRGLSPIPLAYSYLRGRMIKFIRSEAVSVDPVDIEPGTVLSLDGGKILIACGNGAVSVTELLPEGKSRMNSSAFINGRQIAVGDKFTSNKE